MMIHLEAVHIAATYAGTLEGVPPVDFAISSAVNRVIRNWGEGTPTLVLPFTTTEVGKGWDGEPLIMLPQWCICTLLRGPPTDPDEHASELAVIWFTESPQFQIDNIVDQFNWSKHARDFSY